MKLWNLIEHVNKVEEPWEYSISIRRPDSEERPVTSTRSKFLNEWWHCDSELQSKLRFYLWAYREETFVKIDNLEWAKDLAPSFLNLRGPHKTRWNSLGNLILKEPEEEFSKVVG